MLDRPQSSRPRARIALAAVLDVVAVLVFVALGRRQHGEDSALLGLWHTAWPFLAALAVSWLIALVWRRPLALLRSGVPLWIGTVVLGMTVRVLATDGGAPVAFVLVATLALAVLLLGWRLIARLVTHRRGTGGE